MPAVQNTFKAELIKYTIITSYELRVSGDVTEPTTLERHEPTGCQPEDPSS